VAPLPRKKLARKEVNVTEVADGKSRFPDTLRAALEFRL
jgi:hypothetical protein